MAVTILPVTRSFVAEVGDVDLSRPLDADDLDAVKEAFWNHAVLVFPGQDLTQDQQLAFARNFGPLETTIGVYRKDTPLRLRDDIADVSNLDHTGGIWGADSRLRMFQLANRMWHTDSSFKHTPALCSLLYARTIPPLGGHTEFCDLRAAWDALDDATKARIDGLVAEHAIHHSRARYGYDRFTEDERQAMPAVPQVLVRTIPQAGRRSLYLASHAGRILGMDNPAGLELIDGLIRHATADRRFVHQHRWRVGDLVMWDDRCTMHRGTDFDDLRWPRDVQRATVADVANTCEQEGVSVAAE